ncbi:hypothetical protein K491DRAFT_676252 [Lophiostoma macrostomum CBS 122681]|uniref:Uncharacterized protein n=1 Tax=Lophiostoma macrostomum CBS 122681 TaxID=1314788 RepID=A0A6A6TH46_9PLEO|nr:hypothetical protein K491DRAFT_676252 [Lophiostoma macrostomum CBS 122681]
MKVSVTAILLFLGLAAFFYRILPNFTSATDAITSAITSSLRQSISPPSFCTKDVGEGLCCELHLAAEPCIDECRKAFLDRQTFQPTKEYSSCADECLVVYHTTCQDGAPIRHAQANALKSHRTVPQDRRRRSSFV